MSSRTPVIAGIGLSTMTGSSGLTARGHHVLAMQRALADAGVTLDEVDGYANGDIKIADMAEYLGIRYRWLDGTSVGGSSAEYLLQHAAAAIRSGDADVILLTYGSDQLSARGRGLGTGVLPFAQEAATYGAFEAPFGNPLVGAYAMAARRHMHDYGTTSEQLAEIAVAARMYAALNPDAMYREPLTVSDVLSSRLIADPLHKLDCCVVSDGGAAVLVTSEERAKDLRRPPIYIAGAAVGQTHWNISQMSDFTRPAARDVVRRAYGLAGIGPSDVDLTMAYDSFTITALLLLEAAGFCEPGEGGELVETGALRPGGSLPFNTDGGGLSAIHPGMRGMFLLTESVRQLRGEAGAAQIPDARVALAIGSGGTLSTMGATILSTERPA